MVTWTKVGESQIRVTLQGAGPGTSGNGQQGEQATNNRKVLVIAGAILALAGIYYLTRKKEEKK